MAALAVLLGFGAGVLVCLGVWFLLFPGGQDPLVQGRLQRLSRANVQVERASIGSILRETTALSSSGTLNRLLRRLPTAQTIPRLMEQADMQVPASRFLMWFPLCGSGGFVLFFLLTRSLAMGLVGGILGFTLPYFYLKFKRKSRIKLFERQLPDAIKLFSNALRAGHAFPSAMVMVAQEMAPPVGTEFRRAYEEGNLGISSQETLRNMLQRVESLDLQFFVTAVAIQRETGGNLAEILDKLGYVIRERYKLLRQVQVLSTQGRISGYVIGALPFVVAVLIFFLNPGYVSLLWTTTVGKILMALALVLMVIGFFVMRKIINIRV
ncbi:MAG: type II secretion system F family protein [Nitrospinota bacterium]